MTSDIRKYANCKNQELIEIQLESEEKNKQIIKSEVVNHDDETGIEELNVFSTIIIDSTDKKSSKYKKIIKRNSIKR